MAPHLRNLRSVGHRAIKTSRVRRACIAIVECDTSQEADAAFEAAWDELRTACAEWITPRRQGRREG